MSIRMSCVWRPYLCVLAAVVLLDYGFNLTWLFIAASHWALAKIIKYHTVDTVLVGIIHLLGLHEICTWATVFIIGGFEDKQISQYLHDERWKKVEPRGFIRRCQLNSVKLQCAFFQIGRFADVRRNIRVEYNTLVIRVMDAWLEELTEARPKKRSTWKLKVPMKRKRSCEAVESGW